MKLVVTDACIFIDLLEFELLADFLQLDMEVHTTLDVVNELFSHHQKLLTDLEKEGRMVIHILSPEEFAMIEAAKFPRALSPEDCSVLFLARKLRAILLSSDKPVRNQARKLDIEYHGMIWIFDQLVEQGIIRQTTAASKLSMLVHANIVYKGNRELMEEVEKRMARWAK